MEGYSEAIAVMDRPEVAFCKPETPPKVTPTHFSNVSLWGRLLLFVGSIVEYAFGAHMGFAAGWLAGFLLGDTYVEYFKPAYMSDIGQPSYWELLPCRFAKDCAIFGIVAGIVIIAIVKNKLLSQRVIFFCKKGNTDPKNIAQALGRNVRQIEKTMGKLIKKGRIGHKMSANTNDHKT